MARPRRTKGLTLIQSRLISAYESQADTPEDAGLLNEIISALLRRIAHYNRAEARQLELWIRELGTWEVYYNDRAGGVCEGTRERNDRPEGIRTKEMFRA